MQSEIERLQRYLDATIDDDRCLRVLDAGCGAGTLLSFPPTAHITGVDISASQLRQHRSLDEAIVGDVQTYPFPRESFDFIICWDVLEHLAHPELALDSLFRSLKPGGRIILGFPNLFSVKGLVTKMTPFSVHQRYYRRKNNKGRAGPFPVHMKLAMAPRSIRGAAVRYGLTVTYLRMYESVQQVRIRNRLRLTGRRWAAAEKLLRGFTLGLLQPSQTECIMVLTRKSEMTGPGGCRRGGCPPSWPTLLNG